ncbi:MAG: hypothetical protein DME24_01935 [Verrucomicrobia bacterium]|nr:MAG: hypothetical protein DME24_01935 [Verrucomicrobiota bacterium]
MSAAAPTLDHLYPVAIQIGSTNTITAIGKFDPWPAKVWVDAPGIVFNAETNTGKFTVEVATNATVGPHLIRVFNEQGASGPRFLIVTREPQSSEQEPNDDFTKPQTMDHLPVSLNGRLEKSGDVDSFAVTLEAGQTLVASLEAYTLASPIDAVLRLVDSRGVQVTLNDDDGRTPDPLLVWTSKSAGTYILQAFGFAYPATSDVKFTGGNACVYRLHLARGPCLRYTLPLGVQRGARTTLRLFGWNMSSSLGREFEFDGAELPAETREVALVIRRRPVHFRCEEGRGAVAGGSIGFTRLSAGCAAQGGGRQRQRTDEERRHRKRRPYVGMDRAGRWDIFRRDRQRVAPRRTGPPLPIEHQPGGARLESRCGE